jgi:TonB family protein
MRFVFIPPVLSVLLAATVAAQQSAAADIVKVRLDENLRTTVNGVPVQHYPNLRGLFLGMPKPYYPPDLRSRHITGSGTFTMYIDASGKLTDVKIRKSTGHRELDIQAIDALRHWRTKPGSHREIDMPITFTVRERQSFY